MGSRRLEARAFYLVGDADGFGLAVGVGGGLASWAELALALLTVGVIGTATGAGAWLVR